jgi:nitrite reductase (NO-forming)
VGVDQEDDLATIDLSRVINRRAFLGATGLTAAGAVAAACDSNRGTWDRPPKAGGAEADPTEPASSDHSAPLPVGGDRPRPSGDLAAVYDAMLPPLDPNPTRQLVLEAIDALLEVAAGVTMDAWTFGGVVPGPVVHVRQGQTVDFTLRNNGATGHSMDFHSAQTPWDKNYVTILPGEQIQFAWTANYPGVFMYHCGTGPVLQHIANGMYGAVVVDPAQPLRPAREYVLVQSEFYLSQGDTNWVGDLDRMRAVQPDFVVFNGAANQYQQETLKAAPNELIRLYVMNAGPTLFSAFHVIGAIFDRVYADGNPANVMQGISTWTIPPGGGATFEFSIPDPGQYPFVTHSFAYTGLGAVGLIEVA